MNSSKRSASIIYCVESDKIYVLLVKPSNIEFGGPDWQIPKGLIDLGESEHNAAIREAEEEAGLVLSNIDSTDFLMRMNYISVFAIKVKNRKNFKQHDYEIAETKWFSLTESFKVIRSWQKPWLGKFVRFIK
ncbi:MAG: NUDIX domain-containing protein [Methanogenium sp.]|jgi:8-oxo-dGTP pyrophosphatase MutT (NUDIX family)